MNTAQINIIRNGVFSTAIRNMGAGNTRATDRAVIIEAMKVYGLTDTDTDAHHVGAWCIAQMGYGGGL